MRDLHTWDNLYEVIRMTFIINQYIYINVGTVTSIKKELYQQKGGEVTQDGDNIVTQMDLCTCNYYYFWHSIQYILIFPLSFVAY